MPARAVAVSSPATLVCPAPADLLCIHAARDPSLVLSGKMKRLTDAGKPTGHTLTGDAIFAKSQSDNSSGNSSDKATYTIALPSAASYKLWGLLFYPGGPPNDANSFFITVDAKPREVLGNDKNHYQQLHWSGDGSPTKPIDLGALPAGNVTVVVEKREVLPMPPELEILCFTTRASNVPPTNGEALAALSCVPGCTANADCEDGDACTQDTCESGTCSNDAILGCPRCEEDADCAPPKVCSAGMCVCPAPELLCIDAAGDPTATFAGAMKRLTDDGVSTTGTLTGDAIFADSTKNSSGASGDQVTYTVELPASGTWYAWGRLFYPGRPPDDANSFFLKAGSGPRLILGDDKSCFRNWHWNGTGSIKPLCLGSLAAGPVGLVVEKREVLASGSKKKSVPPRLEILCLTQSSSSTPPTDAEALAALSPPACGTTTTTTSTTTTTTAPTTTTVPVPTTSAPTTSTVPATTTSTTTTTTTPVGHCGDDVCSAGEDSCTCPGDCPADPQACSSCECGPIGSSGGDCFCDAVCVLYQDCCSNACDTCGCVTTTTTSSTTTSTTLP